MEEANLTLDERKSLFRILVFLKVERTIFSVFKPKSVGRFKKLIKKKWRKIQPFFTDEDLIFEPILDRMEAKETFNRLILYSRLYTDIIDPRFKGISEKGLSTLMKIGVVPNLPEEKLSVIEKEILPRVSEKGAPKAIKKRDLSVSVLEYPHLEERVRKNLLSYLNNKLRIEEPLLMSDERLRQPIRRILVKHVDRIIHIALDHAYKAIQYGYISSDAKVLSDYVEKKALESLDWTVKSGLVIDELSKELVA